MIRTSRDDEDHRLTRFLKWAIIIPMALALVYVGWVINGEIMPRVVIPPPPSPPGHNASQYFLTGYRCIVSKAQAKGLPLLWDGHNINHTPLSQHLTLVHAVQPGVAIMHQGFRYPYQAPAVRSFRELRTESTSIKQLRHLGWYLSYEATVQAKQQEWKPAMDRCLDAIEIGHRMHSGSSISGVLVGIAIENMGRAGPDGTGIAWDIASHMTAAQARSAAERLAAAIANAPSLPVILQEEKYQMQALLMETFGKSNWRTTVNGLGDYGLFPIRTVLYIDLPAHRTMVTTLKSKRRIMREYTQVMDAAIAGEKRSYAMCRLHPLGDEPFRKTRLRFTMNDTQNRLLLVALAIQAYKMEHGNYPASLTALAPAYLASLPDDPFALKGTFQYKRITAGYLLYSVGPDGTDDGGKAITEEFCDVSSMGDIVAGVNLR